MLNAGADAFHIDNAVREARVTRCHVHGATGNGFYIGENCTDFRFTDCTAATITGYGWQILGAELRFYREALANDPDDPSLNRRRTGFGAREDEAPQRAHPEL